MLSPQEWNYIKFAAINWFSDPQRVLIPLLAIAVTTLLITTRPWKHIFLNGLLGLGLTYLVLISPAGAKATVQGLTLPLPPDTGKPADAIVVLGRGPLAFKARTQAAATLWRSERAPIILSTGYKEAGRLNQQLVRLGVPPDSLITEPEARTTEENAVLSTPLLRQHSVQRIILITDQPHMLRSLLTFRSFGFEVIPHAVTIPSYLPSIEVTILAIREYIGLLSYGALGRFSPALNIAAATGDKLHHPLTISS